MRYVKTIGLLAVTAGALMALAASASATTITGGNNHATATNEEYTGTIHMVNEHHLVTANPIATIECESTAAVLSLAHGSSVTAEANLSELKLSNCTNSWHATTVTAGSIAVHWSAEHEGTVTWTGATLTTTRFGVTCNYVTNGTDIGTLTDSHITKGTATIDLKAEIPVHNGSSFLCGSGKIKWEGAYRITTPNTLYVNK